MASVLNYTLPQVTSKQVNSYFWHPSPCEFSSMIISHLLAMTDQQLLDSGSNNKLDQPLHLQHDFQGMSSVRVIKNYEEQAENDEEYARQPVAS